MNAPLHTVVILAALVTLPANASLVPMNGGIYFREGCPSCNSGVLLFDPPPILDLPGEEWDPTASNITVYIPMEIPLMDGIDTVGEWTADLFLNPVLGNHDSLVQPNFEHGSFTLEWTWISDWVQVGDDPVLRDLGFWQGHLLMMPDPGFAAIDGLARGTIAGPFESLIMVDRDIFDARGAWSAQMDVRPLVVPEPATLSIVALGIAIRLGFRAHRNRALDSN